jgi:hypothetical protein
VARASTERILTYHLYSRTLVPLYALYVAGHAVGRAVYLATDRLGLVSGPLGELKGAFLRSGYMPFGRPTSWMDWLAPLLLGYIVLVELHRQAKAVVPRADRALLAGTFLLFAAHTAATLVAKRQSSKSELGWFIGATLILAGITLAVSRWQVWRMSIRIAAVLTAVASAAIALALARYQDAVTLGTFR